MPEEIINCSEWIGESDWIEITVNTSMPITDKTRGQNHRPKGAYSSSGEDFEQQSEEYEFEEESAEISQELGQRCSSTLQDNTSSSSKFEINSQAIIKPNPIDEEKYHCIGNHHDVGATTNTNAIKITIKDTNIRFLQLVTRYNINEQMEYNLLLKTVENSQIAVAYYSDKEKIKDIPDFNKKFRQEHHLDQLKTLKWKVDCQSTLEENAYGTIFESPYYDQPTKKAYSGAFEITENEKSLYDEPELWDLKTSHWTRSFLCKDVVRFITFIISPNDNKVLGFVEWARIGRPYIANHLGEMLKWGQISTGDFKNFKAHQQDHAYLCKYKIYYVEQYEAPVELPIWVKDLLKKDALNRKFNMNLTSPVPHYQTFGDGSIPLQIQDTTSLGCLIPDKVQCSKRAQDYRHAQETKKDYHTYPELGEDWVHQDTLADGNCALNAFALGLLRHRDKNSFTEHKGFRRQFAKSFCIDSEELTSSKFSQVIDALLSPNINLNHPIIVRILETLSDIRDVTEGSEENQIDAKINAANQRVIKAEAFENGEILPQWRDEAIKCLARQGILYQLAMAYALRAYCFRSNGMPVSCRTGQVDELAQELEFTLALTNQFGEYLEDNIFAFLANEFNVTVQLKTHEFGRMVSYGNAHLAILIFTLRAGEGDCHFELVLPANDSFLKNRLGMPNQLQVTTYPALLSTFGVRQNKVTGPRATNAIMEICHKHGEEKATETQKQFLTWSKAHTRHFNFVPFYTSKRSQELASSQSEIPVISSDSKLFNR